MRQSNILGALFFLSGVSALIYQTAWQRVLGLFAGSDTVAAALVVGAFLLGLGLGSLAAAYLADRLSPRGALAGFALCEVLIAVYAGSSPGWMHALLLGPLAGLAGYGFAVAFALLLLPTALMGMALPLLARASVRAIDGSAGRIGLLYGVNTLGAACGALLGGWVLIGAYGYAVAALVAAGLNLVVAAGVLVLRPGAPEAATPAGDGQRALVLQLRPVLGWCLRVAVSGFLIVGLQILWYRVLGVLMQSSAYAFSLILAVFLLGDALGLAAGAWLVRGRLVPARVFGLATGAMLLVSGLVMLALYAVFASPGLPGWFVDGEAPSPWRAVPVVLALVLPGAILAGLTYPVAQLAIQTDAARIGRMVGLVQLANIFGNAAGSLVAGLVLLDRFGTAGSLIVLMAVAGVFVIASAPRQKAGWVLAAGLAIAIAALPSNAAFWARLHGATPDAIVAEDRSGIVAIRREPNGWHAFFIQGSAQSRVPYAPVHALLGSIGVLAHPNPLDVLVIGVAAGGTPFGAGVRAETRAIHAIDIVAADLTALAAFADRGDPTTRALLADPRYRFARADGRHALFTDGARYDIIEADAMLPTTAFSGALYSREFFVLLRRALNPGGIAVQWAPTPRVRDTFVAVFPHVVELYPPGMMRPDRFIMLGSDTPLPVDTAALAAAYRAPAIAARFRAAGVDPEQLAAAVATARLVIWTPGMARPSGDLNEDLFPRDEFSLNR